MSRRKASFLLVALLLAVPDGHACGDKFLMVGRGSRFQRAYVALHPASLLVVNAKVTGQRELQTALKLAGHSVRLAEPDHVGETFASGRFDFVLADFHDIDTVGRIVPTAPLLPVIDASSRNDFNEAAKRYKCLLGHGRSTKANRRFLAALDLAMDSKLKATPIHCDLH